MGVSCEDCDEENGCTGFYCHQVCLPLHRNKCSSKARALQRLENITATIDQKKATLGKFEAQLESIPAQIIRLQEDMATHVPAKISQLKEEIVQYEKDKVERENEFKLEEEKHDASKKRKHVE